MGESLQSWSVQSSPELGESRTFVSTNLLIVARMSWWPETSSSVSGRYFSTLLSVSRAP